MRPQMASFKGLTPERVNCLVKEMIEIYYVNIKVIDLIFIDLPHQETFPERILFVLCIHRV